MKQNLVETFSLEGRVAVVTGAGSGIGRETARVLAQAGATVVIGDVQEAALQETAQLIGSEGGTAVARRCDVSRRGDIDALVQAALDKAGQLDIWVNCAGIMVKAPMLDIEEAAFERGIAVNLGSVYWGCIAAGHAMKERGGAIVNISSGGGESAVPGMSVYNLTKAAVNMITRSAAKEFGQYGIRVNTVAPGWIETAMVAHAFSDEDGNIDAAKRAEIVKVREQVSPLGLTGVPRDIALAVLYLVSDASRFVTGQNIRPNGGVAML
ncbi:MAG: SDR family oxidoreductase [Sphingobium sp.]